MVVDDLMTIKKLRCALDRLQGELELREAKITSTTIKPKDVDVQTSKASDTMGDGIIACIELEQRIKDIEKMLRILRKALLDFLRKNRNEFSDQEIDVLYLCYYKSKSIYELAKIKNEEYAKWKYIHKKALKKINCL